MRLVYIHEKFGAFGGAEANILASAEGLAARGHTVALAHGPSTGRGEAEWARTFETRFPWADVGGDTEANVSRAIAEFRPDAVFAHNVSDAGALRALSRSASPVVRMVHDHDLCCMRSYKYNVFSRRICGRAASLYCVFPCGASVRRGPAGRLSLKWVSYWAKRREIDLNRGFERLIVASSFMRDELLKNGFSDSKIEVHAPVPRAAAAADTATFGERNLIVYAGQIVRGKGVDVLLESLARVTTPFECVIIGDGSHRHACEQLSDRLGLGERVRFTGFLPQAAIAGYYREASLSVMSSLWPEPFGATGIEAMRCGLPVVAFDAGGIREWLQDGVNGHLVPWMDRSAFAACVDDLLGDKAAARRLGENGRRLASENFNFSSYVLGLEDLFSRVQRPMPAPAATLPLAIDAQLLRNFETFETPTGLWRLRARVAFRRVAWRFIVGGAGMVKRAIDIVASFCALVALSPLFLVVAALVKLDGGRVIFAQTRVGRWGREFKMFKFRSMRPDAERRLAELLALNKHAGGVTFKIQNDPRVTRIGRYLRRYSLDELPQFFNVLLGDMSLVGPRPPVPREVALYTLADRRRLAVKPGITCIWQVSGRANIDFPGQVGLDVRYINSHSVAQDIRILIRTLPAVIFGSGGY